MKNKEYCNSNVSENDYYTNMIKEGKACGDLLKPVLVRDIVIRNNATADMIHKVDVDNDYISLGETVTRHPVLGIVVLINHGMDRDEIIRLLDKTVNYLKRGADDNSKYMRDFKTVDGKIVVDKNS